MSMKRIALALLANLAPCLPAFAEETFTPSFHNAVDHNGKSFNITRLKARNLVFFGFTHCPDICPTTLSKIDVALEGLSQSDRNNTQIIMVSVDPNRDTKAHLKSYIEGFNPHHIALWHKEGDLEKTLKSFNAYRSVSAPDKDGYYNVSHSTLMYVLNKQGKMLRHLPHRSSIEEIQDALK